ncbi:MAG: metal-dependent hydrolase [Kiritimatiellae bacterium]|nr:metal-dependent hydrolase [Kiritimatiellia bacterium]
MRETLPEPDAADRLPRRETLRLLAVAAFLACLPDWDYLPGLLVGELNRYHQLFTHSLAFCAVASAVAARALRRTRLRPPAVAAIVFSHLLLDLLTEDARPPVGIPLLWPFSDRPFQIAPLFPRWEKLSVVQALTSPANLRPVAVELATGVAILLLCLLVCLVLRRRGRG